MAGFKRTKYLSCFYCNRKTSTPYTSGIRQFECPNCDATNYLDKNGEITDPPVATTSTRSSANVQYARPQPSSPTSVSSSDLFCDACLKNQHLFTASLAQYLPGDPDASDYAKLEKKYYRFRKNLEARYPQICASCEPKVRERIERAAYTAKTDTLRRMIDRSRKLQQTKARSGLDLAAAMGQWLWFAGLVSQLLWHVVMLHRLGAYDTQWAQDKAWVATAFWMLDKSLGQLLSPQWLVWCSTAASASSLWWNPRFVQTYRGFTKHIRGLRLWYVYQLIALFIRLLYTWALGMDMPDIAQRDGYAAMHVMGLVLTLLVYFRGHRSITIDTAPLFPTHPVSVSSPPRHAQPPERDGDQSMAQILDDILRVPSSSKPASHTTSSFSRGSANSSSQSSFGAAHRKPRESTSFGQPESARELQSDTNVMDWTPTHSQHRAFNTIGERVGQGFNEAPTEPSGPFWYRVPPAPTTPAQRMFNPPKVHMRTSPAASRNPFSRAAVSQPPRHDGQLHPIHSDAETVEEPSPQPVRFAEPRFFPPQPKNDPLNSLSEIFGQSFSLSQEEQEQEEQAREAQAQEKSKGWLGGFGFGGQKKN